MKGKIKRLIRKARSFIGRNLATRPGRGSGLGVLLRRIIRKFNLQQIIGINLAGFTFFAGIVVPQTREVFSSVEVVLETRETVVIANTAPSTFQWPLTHFGVSQRFSYYHPGMDLTDPVGTSIYPVGSGTVDWVQHIPYGYGKHLLVSHDGNIKSLYAHLSEILVKEGQKVTKETELGRVGTTGRSTGSHLHLEIYENNIPVNPLDILPLLKFTAPTAAVPPKT